MLKRARWAIFSIDVIGIISFMIIAGLNFDDESVEVSSSPEPKTELEFNIHQAIFIGINYICIMIIGFLLLRQIKRYYTEKPTLLMFTLYLILVDFTLALVPLILGFWYNEINSIEIQYDIYRMTFSLLYVNLFDIIPLYLFHKQVLYFQDRYTKDMTEYNDFLNQLINS